MEIRKESERPYFYAAPGHQQQHLKTNNTVRVSHLTEDFLITLGKRLEMALAAK